MPDTAYVTQYREEFIEGFERSQTDLRVAVTTDAMTKGNQAVFNVVDSGGAEPVTRGVNGLIPARADNDQQYTCTLTEWHDKPRKTRFNIFASQGDGRRKMQMTTVKVMNRKIDNDILAELSNATQNTGASAVATLAMVMNAQTRLSRQDVPVDDQDDMFFVASPAFRGYLMQIKEFNSRDWVDVQPLTGPVRRMLRWAGFNWIFTNAIPGVGTASEKCFAFHRGAIGHAFNSGDMDLKAGYNEEDDYSWARTTIFMGSKLLQNKGVLQVNHDGSAFG